MLTLYHSWECPYCVGTRIVLDEKEIEYESVEVDLKNKPDSLFRRNPKGKVPVIQDDDFVLYESHIINEYLDEWYPGPVLMPSGPKGRARARLLYDLCESELSPRVYTLAKQTVLRPDNLPPNVSALVLTIDDVNEVLKQIQKELGDREFILGKFGLADVAFAPWIVGLEKMGMPKDLIPPNVASWGERLQSRPSIARQIGEKS